MTEINGRSQYHLNIAVDQSGRNQNFPREMTPERALTPIGLSLATNVWAIRLEIKISIFKDENQKQRRIRSLVAESNVPKINMVSASVRFCRMPYTPAGHLR